MDDSQLKEVAELLERSADAPDAKLRLTAGKPHLWLTANRAGCLRLAAALLRAAMQPIREEGYSEGDMLTPHQLSQEGTEYRISGIVRTENWPEPEPLKSEGVRVTDGLASAGCAAIALVLVILLGSGVWFWFSMILK